MLLNRLPGRGYSIVALCLLATCASNALAAHIPGQSQLGGWTYIDRNNDGVLAFSNDPNPEFVIGDVTIQLFKVVGGVEQANPAYTTQSDDFGRYLFENIDPSTYNMYEIQPIQYLDGKDTLGSLIQLGGGSLPASSKGTVENKPIPAPHATAGGAFLNIVLSANIGGEFYYFGERGLMPGYVSKRALLASSPSSNTATPEPASMFLVLSAVCGGWLIPKRCKRS